MFIIFLFLFFIYILFNFRTPNLSSYDRQISVLSCIKYHNTCEHQDLVSIRKMCFIFLKGANIFPKETTSSDIVDVCNKQFQTTEKNWNECVNSSLFSGERSSKKNISSSIFSEMLM